MAKRRSQVDSQDAPDGQQLFKRVPVNEVDPPPRSTQPRRFKRAVSEDSRTDVLSLGPNVKQFPTVALNGIRSGLVIFPSDATNDAAASTAEGERGLKEKTSLVSSNDDESTIYQRTRAGQEAEPLVEMPSTHLNGNDIQISSTIEDAEAQTSLSKDLSKVRSSQATLPPNDSQSTRSLSSDGVTDQKLQSESLTAEPASQTSSLAARNMEHSWSLGIFCAFLAMFVIVSALIALRKGELGFLAKHIGTKKFRDKSTDDKGRSPWWPQSKKLMAPKNGPQQCAGRLEKNKTHETEAYTEPNEKHHTFDSALAEVGRSYSFSSEKAPKGVHKKSASFSHIAKLMRLNKDNNKFSTIPPQSHAIITTEAKLPQNHFTTLRKADCSNSYQTHQSDLREPSSSSKTVKVGRLNSNIMHLKPPPNILLGSSPIKQSPAPVFIQSPLEMQGFELRNIRTDEIEIEY